MAPFIFGGATFDTNDNPIGLRNSSATVMKKYDPINQYGLT